MSDPRWPELPVKYDPMGYCIWDANGSKVLDMRGWGRLTGHGSGGLKLPPEEGRRLQDELAERIVGFINGGTNG
jgi:hypothetical protein